MTTTHDVPMPEPDCGTIRVGYKDISLGYSEEAMRAYADARCAKLQAIASEHRDGRLRALEDVAGLQAAMRQILEERGFRSDGDAEVLVQRIRDMSIEDRDVIACAQGNFAEMKSRRDALAGKVKAMEDDLREVNRCNRPDCPHAGNYDAIDAAGGEAPA